MCYRLKLTDLGLTEEDLAALRFAMRDRGVSPVARSFGVPPTTLLAGLCGLAIQRLAAERIAERAAGVVRGKGAA